MPIVCPVNDGGDVAGIGVFTTGLEETKKIMDEDPGVKAGIFAYEVRACRCDLYPRSWLCLHKNRFTITIHR